MEYSILLIAVPTTHCDGDGQHCYHAYSVHICEVLTSLEIVAVC